MSKYRVEFSHSRVELILNFVLAVLFIASIYSWKPQVIVGQWFVQSALSFIVGGYFYRLARQLKAKRFSGVTFTGDGQWTEIQQGSQQQISWHITPNSRVTSLVLFLKLASAINAKETKWILIFHDQVTALDYRRLCRAIIFQQQKMGS